MLSNRLFRRMLLIVGVLGVVLTVLGRFTATAPPTLGPEPPLAEVAQPIPTPRGVLERSNTWYSGLLFSFPTPPLFALPGAYRFSSAGIEVSTPTPAATPNTIFGSFATICTFGDGQSLEGVRLDRYGDWDIVVAATTSGTARWRAQIASGSPVLTLTGLSRPLSVDCGTEYIIEESGAGSIVVKRGEERVLVVQADGPAERFGKTLSAESGRYRIFHWPTETDRSVESFLALPWSEMLDTQMVVSSRGTNSRVELKTLTSADIPGLMTVWPHHRLAALAPTGPILGSYSTALGRLDLVATNQLSFEVPGAALPAAWEPVRDASHRAAISAAIVSDIEKRKESVIPAGVYFGGAWLGSLASLALLADAYAVPDAERDALDRLEVELRARLPLFRYDEERRMLVAENTEFGNEKGNDHHFHYGYYIRAAAVLVAARPELREEFAPMIDEMVRDIATTERTSTHFPFLRHFDPYAGHSWADGQALFADGNNQESTSEALNSWYALTLWYSVTGRQAEAALMRSLWSYELLGTRAYWFGDGNPFLAGYDHPMASLVWGGKRDYATWFSGEAMHIHGIQWLPITPASGYLGTLPNFTERINELRRSHPNPAAHEWGDLYTAHLSYSRPSEAVRLLPTAQQKRAMESTALLLHIVYENLERGR